MTRRRQPPAGPSAEAVRLAVDLFAPTPTTRSDTTMTTNTNATTPEPQPSAVLLMARLANALADALAALNSGRPDDARLHATATAELLEPTRTALIEYGFKAGWAAAEKHVGQQVLRGLVEGVAHGVARAAVAQAARAAEAAPAPLTSPGAGIGQADAKL